MTLYRDILNLLDHRMVVHSNFLSALYICSIGSHMFNIKNKSTRVFTEGALLADARLHVVMVTVPGFGKSFMLKQFLNNYNGICSNTKLKPSFAAAMTTASFVGSIKTDKEGNPVINKGICETYKTSILGIHEFAEITKSMTLSYNIGLQDALLAALDDGHIRKDVAAGGLDYITMLTLFTAVQPARYDLTSGLGRRLCFIIYIPTYSDIDKFRKNRRKGRYVKDDIELLAKIRASIDKKYDEVNKIKNIIFTEKFYQWMDKNNIIPYEEILYERIGIGYTIMNSDTIPEELIVDIDAELSVIMNRQKKDRRSIKIGIDSEQIWRVIKDEDEIDKDKLIDFLLEFSLSRMDILSRLKTLTSMGWIKEFDHTYKILKKERR